MLRVFIKMLRVLRLKVRHVKSIKTKSQTLRRFAPSFFISSMNEG